MTETVTVTATSVELQTESSELGRVTDSEMLENLPLVTRNFTQVIGLNPGVAQEVNNAAARLEEAVAARTPIPGAEAS